MADKVGVFKKIQGHGRNVLILGINSTLGIAIEQVLLELGYTVWGSYCNTTSPSGENRFHCDLREMDQIHRLIEQLPPKLFAVINCAVPFYEDANPKAAEVWNIYYGLLTTFEFIAPRLEEWGKFVSLVGQCVVTEDINGAVEYTNVLKSIHAWNMDFNEKFASLARKHAVSYCLGMTDTRELSSLSPALVESYRATVPDFVDPTDVGLSIAVHLSMNVLPVEIVWNPNNFLPLVVRKL